MSKREPIKLLDAVLVTENFSDEDVAAGDLGTVVEIYTSPGLAFDVEFVNPDGSMRALLTLKEQQLRRLDVGDVLTTRRAT